VCFTLCRLDCSGLCEFDEGDDGACYAGEGVAGRVQEVVAVKEIVRGEPIRGACSEEFCDVSFPCEAIFAGVWTEDGGGA
jgi:hypothetical protein